MSTSEQYNDDIDEGKLISQDPARDTQCSKGTKVTLVFSKGKKPAATVTVPDLKNKTPSEAEAALAKLNLKGAVGESVESSEVENGKVASQDQAAGSDAKEGDTITYHLSTGVGKADAGNHAGEYYLTVQSELTSAGFTNVKVDREYSDSVEKDCVISQSPTGSQSKDTQITLVISKGPKPSSNTSTGGNNSGTVGGNGSTSSGDSSSTGDSEAGGSDASTQSNH